MNDNQEEVKVLKSTYKMAKELLELYGEFYPFAMGVNNDLEIFTINTFSGEEQPDVQEHLEELTKAVKVRVKENKLFAVTICVNVTTFPPYTDEKMEAIEIRINNCLGDSVNYYIPYEIHADSVKFFELFEKAGQLKIW